MSDSKEPSVREALHLFYDHPQVAVCRLDHGPLTGLRHRTVIDHRTGAAALALWQEEHKTGFRVPLHFHDCEEIITVIEGSIEATIGGQIFQVAAQQSVLIPTDELHGFRVTSERAVRLLAIFSSPDPEIFKVDGSESTPPWEGGTSDHLET